MDSPDYMILNPMCIAILKIPKKFKILGEIHYSKKFIDNKKDKEEIHEFIDKAKLKTKIPLVIDV